MKTRLLTVFMMFLLCFALWMVVSPAEGAVVARQAVVSGGQVGEVVSGEDVIFRIRTSAGGLTPFQRAEVVAGRLDSMMAQELTPEDVTTGRRNNMDVVLAKGEVVVTADAAHARINNTDPATLANLWAQRLRNVVGDRPVDEAPVVEEPVAEEPAVQEVRLAEKVVPVISVGSGLRVGAALVTGPSAQLAQVNAVAQIDGNFRDAARIRAYVPVSSENVVENIRRVPQTSVIGLADLRL